MSKARVLLADDHAIVVEGLRRVLEADFEIAEAVSDGRALVSAAARLRPDVIVADVSMPLLNGIDAARAIRKMDRKVKIVFLTMHPDATYAAEALAAGGSGYVLKSSAGRELLAAIDEAMNGGTYVTPSIAEQVFRPEGRGPHGRAIPARKLTRRQREVVQLVAEGRSVKEIAGRLALSTRTVEFHKYRIMAQLGLSTTAELIHYALTHQIVME